MLVKNYKTGKCYFYGTEITPEKYDEIKTMLADRPATPEGYEYFLNAELEWELTEIPAEPLMDETAAKAAAYDILTGGAE